MRYGSDDFHAGKVGCDGSCVLFERGGTKFYINFLYILSKVLNLRDDYKMGYLGQTEELICYNDINPTQYVFHEDTETCTPVYTEYFEDYKISCRECISFCIRKRISLLKDKSEKIIVLTNEENWDKLLKIKTTGRDDSKADVYNYPYEPTPYSVLERLANAGWVGKKDVVLDYGCGKGRVEFFLAYQVKAEVIGIEYDERIYQAALTNKQSARRTMLSAEKVSFFMEDAKYFQVPDHVNKVYFFNPFSVEVLRKVMAKIIDSYYRNPREILLMFYYPSDEYVIYLMTVDELEFFDELECDDLFEGKNRREIVMAWKIGS